MADYIRSTTQSSRVRRACVLAAMFFQRGGRSPHQRTVCENVACAPLLDQESALSRVQFFIQEARRRTWIFAYFVYMPAGIKYSEKLSTFKTDTAVRMKFFRRQKTPRQRPGRPSLHHNVSLGRRTQVRSRDRTDRHMDNFIGRSLRNHPISTKKNQYISTLGLAET